MGALAFIGAGKLGHHRDAPQAVLRLRALGRCLLASGLALTLLADPDELALDRRPASPRCLGEAEAALRVGDDGLAEERRRAPRRPHALDPELLGERRLADQVDLLGRELVPLPAGPRRGRGELA